MYGTTDGGKAVLIFPTKDAADSFVKMRQLPSDLQPLELTGANIVEWLQNAKSQGATCFVLNPESSDSLSNVRYAPLDAAIFSLNFELGK